MHRVSRYFVKPPPTRWQPAPLIAGGRPPIPKGSLPSSASPCLCLAVLRSALEIFHNLHRGRQSVECSSTILASSSPATHSIRAPIPAHLTKARPTNVGFEPKENSIGDAQVIQRINELYSSVCHWPRWLHEDLFVLCSCHIYTQTTSHLTFGLPTSRQLVAMRLLKRDPSLWPLSAPHHRAFFFPFLASG